jgi:diaphanous 1
MKNFFWSKIKFTEETYKNSQWSKIDDTKIQLDIKTLEAAFGARKKAAKGGGGSGTETKTNAKKKREKISLVDGKRQQNCGIALKRFRMPFAQLKKIIVECDSNQLTAEMCSSLIRVVPTKDEVSLVNDYDGDVHDLMETELFFREVGDVPRLSERLKCVLTTFTFADALKVVREKRSIVHNAIETIKTSTKFTQVVTIVLALGNYLNGGTKKGGAHGFMLKDLEKLLQVKTTDNKGTLMHYLSNYLNEQKTELVSFVNELKPVMDACSVNFGELFKDFNGQKKQLNSLKKEAETANGLGSENFKRRMLLFISDAETLLTTTDKELNLSWAALSTIMIGWGEKEPKQGSDPDPASNFFEQISKFCKAYKRAADENQRRKDLAAKKARQEAEKAARAAKRAAKNGGTKGGAAKEDIFDAFDQKMRGGNANDIISEFKNRHNKGRRSNLGKPEKSGVGGAMRNELAAVLGRRR